MADDRGAGREILRAIAVSLAVGVLYLVVARIAVVLNDPANVGASFWPGAGITTAALLLAPRRWWPWLLLSVGGAEAAHDLILGFAPAPTAWWVVANCVEPLIVALLVRRWDADRFTGVRDIVQFGIAVTAGAAVGAVLGATGAVLDGSGFGFASTAGRWLLADGLGILTVAPAVVLLGQRPSRRRLLRGYEQLLVLLSFFLLAALQFHIGPWSFPWVYLVLPPLLWAALRFGVTGGAVGTLLLAQIGNVATALGRGPFATAGADPAEAVLGLQGYLAVMAFALLLIGARTQESVDHLRSAERARQQTAALEAAEQLLRVSESRFRGLFDSAHVGIALIDLQGRFLEVNPSLCETLGCTQEALRQHDVVSASHPDDRDQISDGIARLVAGEVPVHRAHTRLLHRDGHVVHVDITATSVQGEDGEPVHTVLTIEDISSRVHAEQLLEDSESLQRVAAQLAQVGGWAIDLPQRHVTWSEGLHRMLRSPGEPAPGLISGLDRYADEDRSRVVAAFEACAVDGVPMDLEVGMQRFDGRLIRVRLVAEAQVDAEGRPTKVVGALQDVTAQHRAAQELQTLADRLATTLESITDGVFTLDREWRFTYLNSRAERILQRAAGSLHGKVIWEEFPEAVGSVVDEAYSAAMADGATQVVENYYYGPLDAWFRVRAYPAEQGVTAYFQDVTAHKHLEAQLRRAQRMESIGTLAGGIAHDLNNILTPIMMAVGMLQSDPDAPVDPSLLRMIGTNTQRGADIVRQILMFARGIDGARASVDLRVLLADVTKIVDDTFLKGIEVRTHVDDDLWSVTGDATQLHQVLLNLCVNARDAMQQGGVLVLEAVNVTLDDEQVELGLPQTSGRFVRIAVQDDGAGIPPELLERIWDPFFTTKAVGEGTGLGLSTTQGIVSSHGGFVHVDSTVGRGTTFLVHLPAAPAEELTAAHEPSPDRIPYGDGRLVLVVDDEELIRQVMAATLRRAGFRVVETDGGEEAVRLLAAHPAEVALAVTDMMMPGMDGPTTVDALRTIRPDLPIVAASGLHDQANADRAAAAGVRHLLPKPFSVDELLAVVREAIASVEMS
jgi:PAS domain S-box-containing protein